MLQTTVTVTALAAGATTTVSHGLTEGTPDHVWPTTPTSITVVTVTSTSITFRNDGNVSATATFVVRVTHSIMRGSSDATQYWTAETPTRPVGVDRESLINGDLRAPEWRNLWSSQAISVSPRTVSTEEDSNGFRDSFQVNGPRNAPANGRLGVPFIAPLTGTIRFQLDKVNTISTTNGGSFALAIFNTSDAVLTSTLFALSSSTAADKYIDYAVTAGVEYRVAIVVMAGTVSSVQNQMVVNCGRASVKYVSGATGFWVLPFTRVDAAPRFLHDNIDHLASTKYWRSSTASRLVLAPTYAEKMIIETTASAGGAAAFGMLTIRVNGRRYTTVAPTATVSTLELSSTVTLPSGLKTIEIVHGCHNTNDSGATVGGIWMRAVYLDAPDTYAITPVRGNTRTVVYHDSLWGHPGTYGESLLTLLRQYGRNVVSDGWGSRQLNHDGSTAAGRIAIAARIAKANPDEVIVCIGTNDYGGSSWTALSFGTAFADLLDQIHARCPAAKIWVVSPLRRSTETANGVGSTLGDYRTQQSTAVSTRTDWAEYIDGSTLNSATTIDSLADGVHLNDLGHGLVIEKLVTAMAIAT